MDEQFFWLVENVVIEAVQKIVGVHLTIGQKISSWKWLILANLF